MKKKSILVATHIAPWPLRANGISIRFYPLLERLANYCDIDVLVFGEHRDRLEDDPILNRFRRVTVYPNPQRRPTVPERITMAASVASPWSAPLAYASYHVAEVNQRLWDFVGAESYDVLLWVAYYHRPKLSTLRSIGKRIVYDSVDSPSLHYERSPHGSGLAKLIKPYDLWKCRRWERSLERDSDACIYISPVDACAAFGGRGSPATVIPNGIYPPHEALPTSVSRGENPCIGFLGHMGYEPNVLGAKNLHDNIFRPLKKRFPNLRLKIIGRNPAPEIVALRAPDVEVTGTVRDIWEHIHSVDAFVFPMISGGGLQNKILETMFAAKPVVTTSICSGSIGAQSGSEILCEDTIDGLQNAVAVLLSIPGLAKTVGERGRDFVLQTFDLDKTLSMYEQVLFGGWRKTPKKVNEELIEGRTANAYSDAAEW